MGPVAHKDKLFHKMAPHYAPPARKTMTTLTGAQRELIAGSAGANNRLPQSNISNYKARNQHHLFCKDIPRHCSGSRVSGA